MIKYFKVYRGFGENDYIPIDERELKKAVYAHITGKTAVFENGTISGTIIQAIMPDYNRAMGWNNGYKPTPEDWADIRTTLPGYEGCIAQIREDVRQALKSGDMKLLETA